MYRFVFAASACVLLAGCANVDQLGYEEYAATEPALANEAGVSSLAGREEPRDTPASTSPRGLALLVAAPRGERRTAAKSSPSTVRVAGVGESVTVPAAGEAAAADPFYSPGHAARDEWLQQREQAARRATRMICIGC